MVAVLTGPSRQPRSGGKPNSVVVMLHGIGSDGEDLIGLADALGDAIPHTAFYAPNAPHRFDMAPFGYQWYSRRTEEARQEGVRSVAPTVNEFIDAVLAEEGLEASRCVLLGFSQGAIVSLHTAPRRENSLAGVVAFSGAMITADTLPHELGSRPPILLVHGDADATLPWQGSKEAGEVLRRLDVPEEVHILQGLGHGIDHRALGLAAQFLQRILGTSQGGK